MTYSFIFMEFSAFHIHSLRFFVIKNSIMRVNMEKETKHGMRKRNGERKLGCAHEREREKGRD